MLAKCANCQHVFRTETYGLQSCPNCGAELMVHGPGGEGQPQPPTSGTPEAGGAWGGGEVSESSTGLPPGGAPPGGGLPPFGGDGPQDQPTPWEQRDRLGFFPALVETIKRSFVDPVGFFGRMRIDNADGAISYYWLLAGFGTLVGQLWQAALAAVGVGAPAGGDGPFATFGQSGGPLFHLMAGVIVAALSPIFLFISAGIIHLCAMLFRSAERGFNATLRAVAYSSGPAILYIIPMCGGLIGGIWTLVLIVIGVWKTQRSSVGQAVGAVLVPVMLLVCCVCGAAIFASAMAGMGAAASMGN
jgi:hypothetical protein